MKKNFLNMLWLMVAALILASCSNDDDPIIPKLSITADAIEISETATSALVVKVNADAPLGTAYNVGIAISGTAVEGVNYQEIAKTVTIPANQTSANIFVTPINVSAIEDSKVVNIELQAGTGYELSTPANVDIIIVDNANPPSDAPEVSFATSNIVTNPYMEEVKTITVGLSKTFATDLVIPLTITGDLVADTDYEIAGLTNDAITIPAGNVSADFTVTMKYTGNIGMDKTVTFGFETPSVTDYAVKATENTVAINAVDPQVDFTKWFNDLNTYDYFFAGGGAYEGTMPPYRTDLEVYRVKSLYWNNVDAKYSSMSTLNFFAANADDSNQWKEVINHYNKELGYKNVDIIEQERHEVQCGDIFGLTKFFSNEATYSRSEIKTDGWLRFVSTDASASEGTVVVPEQTITLYKIKDGVDWKAKTTVDVEGGTESYYFWYEDSRNTQGDISQSSNVTPVEVQIQKTVGTYNLATGIVDIDVVFTCADADIVVDEKYATKDGDTYTIKLQYTFYAE
ncbi:hypothetical protein [Marinifilum sp. D714]|uniref:hypothetical protein n=1 Tax=Marinifilum sp. D714 TaxID=2937523 RepID=UPI0027BD7EF1|nr:hypothetical protein [Marinifilum sp. D714]MDQ2178947.1 hypothetical protein [Marinifilum sp. D714]